MKSIKTLIIAVLSLALAAPAFADNQLIDSLIGAAVGTAAGSKVGKGNGRKAAMVAGALGGAWVGSTIGDDSERRHRETLRSNAWQTSAERNGYVSSAESNYQPAPRYQEVEYVAQPVQRQQVIVRQSYQPMQDCDTENYNGEYDPEMAQAYCRGQAERARIEARRMQREKERAIQNAYQAGLRGQ